MSPEIMLGMDFDEKADIFSFGVILVELLAWKISDGLSFMKRVIPGFGFDEKEIRQYETEISPPAYVDLVLQCIDTDTKSRINMKGIQQGLKLVEMSLATSKNVGTIFIAKTNLDSLDIETAVTMEDKQLNLTLIHSDVFSESSYPSIQRINMATAISHNIPHRFTIHRTANISKKCEHCEKHISFKHLRCDECGCYAHMDCADKLPRFCGLTKSLQNLVSPHKSLHSAESLLSPLTSATNNSANKP
eukprot:NODE_349_length_8994_cov_1.235526.p5 type:complete len:247 gc:universal NODE_349_length_8994_cov_1.235526:2792-2052(-)